MTFAMTSSQGKRAGSWNMTMRSRPGSQMRLPSARIWPESGCSRPAMILRRVDFPQPLGPTRQTNSPSTLMLRLTSSSALTAPRPVAKTFETCSTESLHGGTGLSSSPRTMGIELGAATTVWKRESA